MSFYTILVYLNLPDIKFYFCFLFLSPTVVGYHSLIVWKFTAKFWLCNFRGLQGR